MMRTTTLLAALALVACNSKDGFDPTRPDPGTTTGDPYTTTGGTSGPTTPPTPTECDAGTEAWVTRVMPLMWGRRPHGSAEVQMWARVADAHGREAVVRAMTQHYEYLSWYRDFFTDQLYVARTGDKEFDQCFQAGEMTTYDGSLAQFIRANAPDAGGFGQPFNMADVLADALVADDVSVIYQAHLFARMEQPVQGANVSDEELEYNRRVNFGEMFYGTYLNRDMGCLICHNSEYSVTDSPYPEEDRTWTLGGYFEKALLGYSSGISTDSAYAMFRYEDIVPNSGGIHPWGMSDDCGRFNHFSALGGDFLGQNDSFFINEYGNQGSIWQIERDLAAGADALANGGLAVAGDQTVAGPDAFAYLVGANIADLVWQHAVGERLTIAHHLSRNEPQATRLKAFTDALVDNGFSLEELLVQVATDPYFNAGLPQTCGADPYGMDPVVNPWSISEEDEAMQGNGPGDLVHRLTARALIRSTHSAMNWKNAATWDLTDDEEEFQAAIGVFLRESQPGFNGTDFQGALAFEAQYGRCRSPEPMSRNDFIGDVLEQGTAELATVGDAVVAIKDRLTGQPLTTDETVLVESLLGTSLSTTLDAAPADLEEKLRLFCGANLLSAEFHMALDPEPIGPIPQLAQGLDEDCQLVVDLMATAGTTITCVDGLPDVGGTGSTP